MATKIDTDYLLRVVDALPADLRTVIQLGYGLDGEAYSYLEIGRILKITRARVGQKREKAERLLLMAIDNPELTADDLPDLLAVARIRKLAGGNGQSAPELDPSPDPAPH
jgi:hypothetical protein